MNKRMPYLKLCKMQASGSLQEALRPVWHRLSTCISFSIPPSRTHHTYMWVLRHSSFRRDAKLGVFYLICYTMHDLGSLSLRVFLQIVAVDTRWKQQCALPRFARHRIWNTMTVAKVDSRINFLQVRFFCVFSKLVQPHEVGFELGMKGAPCLQDLFDTWQSPATNPKLHP